MKPDSKPTETDLCEVLHSSAEYLKTHIQYTRKTSAEYWPKQSVILSRRQVVNSIRRHASILSRIASSNQSSTCRVCSNVDCMVRSLSSIKREMDLINNH